jgi:hypothetical protein
VLGGVVGGFADHRGAELAELSDRVKINLDARPFRVSVAF